VNPYDFPGFVGGMTGTWLFLIGFLVAAGAAVRVALVIRRPGQGRVARGVLAGGGVVGIAGCVLFYGAQATRHASAFDRAAIAAAIASVVVGTLTAVRLARRRPPDGRPAAPPAP
jgi:drug/metabolite transporter (DMT)-like permease